MLCLRLRLRLCLCLCLCLCLRLAVIKCHARGEVGASGLKLARVGGGARLSFSPQWAEDHPRTAYLLREEADLWARQGALLLTLN